MQHIRFLVGLLGFVVIASLCIGNSESTPLDDYVHANDSYFAWTVIKTYQQPDYDLYILNFTSQKWLDGKVFFFLFFLTRKYLISIETVTNHAIWWHYLSISVPHVFKRPNTALLFIDGGGNGDQ
jgi:hypothetical protein